MSGRLYDSASYFDENGVPRERCAIREVDLTPESVLVQAVISSSPAASGLIVYPDFAAAVLDAWYMGLEENFGGEKGEEIPAELRTGRQAFKALLDRWRKEGYKPDMGPELTRISREYCKGYVSEFVAALPGDLDEVLGMLLFPDDEDDEAPPMDNFDLNNPEHFDWLEQRLEQWAGM